MTISCIDIYQNNGVEHVGGNSLNFATWANKDNNTEVSFLGAVGTDRYGKLIQDHFLKEKIDISHLYQIEGRTATSKIYLDEVGERYFRLDSWDGGVWQSFRLSETDWNFVGKHDIIAIPCWDPNLLALLEHKTGSNKLVVDFANLRDWDFLQQRLPFCDLAFINGDQAIAEQIKALSIALDKIIVVTLGAAGSIVLERGQPYYQPAVKVANVVDTNGCGDAYQAAFAVSFFMDGNIMKAMEAGSIAAAEIITHLGGVN